MLPCPPRLTTRRRLRGGKAAPRGGAVFPTLSAVTSFNAKLRTGSGTRRQFRPAPPRESCPRGPPVRFQIRFPRHDGVEELIVDGPHVRVPGCEDFVCSVEARGDLTKDARDLSRVGVEGLSPWAM